MPRDRHAAYIARNGPCRLIISNIDDFRFSRAATVKFSDTLYTKQDGAHWSVHVQRAPQAIHHWNALRAPACAAEQVVLCRLPDDGEQEGHERSPEPPPLLWFCIERSD